MVVSNLSAGGVEEESKSSQQQQPCLLITDRRENCRIQTNMFNNKPQLLYDVGGEIPEFLGRRIGCSFGEWVLLTGSSDNDVLVNLLSKEKIELPTSDIPSSFCFCALTSHPYDPTCHILYWFIRDGDSYGEDIGFFLIFFQPGDKKFTIKNLNYDFLPTAVCDGKLLLTIDRSLAVVEFKESTYSFEVVEMDDSEIRVCAGTLVYWECSGELFSIYQTTCGVYMTGFEIFKADLLNKKWVSVKNLGTLAIFIGCGGGAQVVECASVESGGIKANSIYFLERFDLDNYYIYNLEEGTIRLNPTFSSSLEMETTKDTQLDWIMIPGQASFSRLVKGDQERICQDSEKEKKRKREEVGVQNPWNMVPPELLNLIQLHLFGRDNALFRVVCKAWHQASIPALLSSTALLELCQSSSPLLMFQENMSISCDSVPIFRFFDPVHKKLYRTGISQLRETDIQCSKDGWLLVSRHSDKSIFFFNPLTQEKIELPGMPLDSYFSAEPYTLSFSSLPTSSNCLVVGIHYKMFYTLKHREGTWRKQEMGEFQIVEYERCPVVLNGLHHFISRNRDMVVYNLKDGVEGQFYGQSWPTKFEKYKCLHVDDFFLEIDGALALVRVAPDGGQVSIYKWNYLEKGWELMEGGVDFGGKEMFLSRRGSFMEKIDDVGGLGNTIFLPMVDDGAKEGVFYSLATHMYHTFYSGYSSKVPYNIDNFLNGIWVKPDRKIVGERNLKWLM